MIDATAVIGRFATLVGERYDELTALDQRAGDGDFGDNLRGGLELVLSRLAGRSETMPHNSFAIAGEVFLDEVGGTSGPLIGLLFQSMGAHNGELADGELADGELADGVAQGLAAIQRVGEAQVGDRTMVDALAPASAALTAGRSLADVAHAAFEGTRRTSAMRARSGRASYIGERVRGHPDPGAAGIALLFRALAEVAEPGAELAWTTADLVAPG